MRTTLPGRVVGILSGDSLIVRFDQVTPPIQIVSLEHLIAPKFGSPDGQIPDEPFGFDSWNFMRKLCIGQRVVVISPVKRVDMSRSHPAFGRLPLFFSRVFLNDADIGYTCCRAGWIKIRAPKVRDQYVMSLFQAEAEAREAKSGIWAGNGTVRKLPAAYNPRDLIAIGEFNAIVDSVINGTTLSLFLMPNHEHLILRVAACRSPSAKKETSASYGMTAKEFTIMSLLHRDVKVRLCSCNEADLFIGPILDLADKPIRQLISLGMAAYNVHTSDLTPSSHEYERCEEEAKAKRLKIWEDEPPVEQIEMTFEGIVTAIVGSCAMKVDVYGDSRMVQLSCISTPDYVAGGGSDPLGFEVRERLRKLLIGQVVSVIVDGVGERRYYATVMLGDLCVNTMLCREGFAFVTDPIVGRVPQVIGQMKDAQMQARGMEAGIWSRNIPPPLQVKDLSVTIYPDEAMKSFDSLAGRVMSGIVENVLGGNRFIVLVPDRRIMLRLAVNGLLPIAPSDFYGRQATTYAQMKYLNREIEFDVHEVDKSGGFLANMYLISPQEGRTDIAKALLFAGLAEVHKRTAKGVPNYDELVKAQEEAQAMKMGKWSGSKCDKVRVEFDQMYPVRVIEAIDSTTFVVQFVRSAMKEVYLLLPSATTPALNEPRSGDVVCVVIDGNRYRARIESVYAKSVKAMLIDYEIMVQVERTALFDIPPRLLAVEPQAMTVALAFVADEKQKPQDREYVKSLVSDVVMYMMVVYVSDYPHVLLLEKPDITSGSLNAMVARNTSAKLVHTDIAMDRDVKQIVESLKKYAAGRQ